MDGLVGQLVGHWLGEPHHSGITQLLLDLANQCDAAGFQLVTVQVVDLLRCTSEALSAPALADLIERSSKLRAQQGMVAMTEWFARQERWERQLAALAKLNTSDKGADNSAAQSRLISELGRLSANNPPARATGCAS
ncbi:MAG: hypothetical protein IPN53_00780 [Comamonadaceae bacterium]|nr:hypothetical protein [Comamonadaceae bacterium]